MILTKLISLDFIKNQCTFTKARLFHPLIDDQKFLIVKHVPDLENFRDEEIVIADMSNPHFPTIFNRINMKRVFGIDFTAGRQRKVYSF